MSNLRSVGWSCVGRSVGACATPHPPRLLDVRSSVITLACALFSNCFYISQPQLMCAHLLLFWPPVLYFVKCFIYQRRGPWAVCCEMCAMCYVPCAVGRVL